MKTQPSEAINAFMSSPSLALRPLGGHEEYAAAQELQRRAWGIVADGYVLPVSVMISIQHAGGFALGAFDGERLVGFSLGYLGRVHDTLVLFSQLTAVEPSLQARGVGTELKRAQAAWARDHGLSTVAWCFDPLQARNASLVPLEHAGLGHDVVVERLMKVCTRQLLIDGR